MEAHEGDWSHLNKTGSLSTLGNLSVTDMLKFCYKNGESGLPESQGKAGP